MTEATIDDLDTREHARSSHRRLKKKVIIGRNHLDGRSAAAKRFLRIVSGVAAELGGDGNLTTVQRELVEAFAGAAVHVVALNTLLVSGHDVDILAHSTAISTLCRVASRIGVGRIPRDVTTLDEYLAEAPEATDVAMEDAS
jgi:hypothetical protein